MGSTLSAGAPGKLAVRISGGAAIHRPSPTSPSLCHRLEFVREVLGEAAGLHACERGAGSGAGSEWHGVEASTWHAELVSLFDPAVSPRNTALVAWRV